MPRFTLRMGVPVAAKMREAASRVPSPPRTMTSAGFVLGQLGARNGRRAGGVRSAFRVQHRREAVLAQPRDELRQQPRQLFLLGLGDDGDRRSCGISVIDRGPGSEISKYVKE